MTFLEICQGYTRDCDIGSGEDAISAVTGQVGELNRVVGDIINAWKELQMSKATWKFMRSTFTLSTTASDGIYTSANCTDVDDSAAISRFGGWRFLDPVDPPKIYLTSTGVGGERWLTYTPWEFFKSVYRIHSQNNGPPQHISFDPQENIVLGPVPDAAYTVTGDYYKSIQILAADTDVPDCKSNYHTLIQALAMKKYAFREHAPEILDLAEDMIGPLWKDMLKRELPPMDAGVTLV